jgi:Carboxypeptidase regulatory-like domain/TonB dependent receptor
MKLSLARIGLLVMVCTLLFLAAGTMAQTGTSTIRGEVSDAQGRMVAGATVTLKNPNTGFSRTQTTGSAGGYSFELISPGEYTLEVEAKGFKKVVRNVTALVGSTSTADLQLEVGSVSQVVQVEAGAAVVAINTEDATIGNNFENSQIIGLPLKDRNILGLLTLQPGVTYAIDPASTTSGSVNGARSDQSNLTLDGVDINEAQTSHVNEPVLRLNSEATEEFRLTTLNAPASQGRSSAAQVNLVTKSGTNNFHGAGFESYRGTGWTSNSFFNNRTIDPKTGQPLPRPALIRNTYGGGVGGPIVKDKLFFFYSYEGNRESKQGTNVQVVPLPSMGQGILNYRDSSGGKHSLTTAQLNQVFPLPGGGFLQMNPAALAVFANAASKYPANDFTVGDSTGPGAGLLNTAGFRFNFPISVKDNSHVLKLDTNLTSKQTAFIRFNYIVDHDTLNAGPQFPDTFSPTAWQHPWGFVAGHTWTIGNNWVNNFRYGLTRQAFTQIGDLNSTLVNFRFVFLPVSGLASLSRRTPVHNILDDVAWVKNKHTIQMGTNIRLISNNRVSFANAFDDATTNPSGYQQGGNVVSDPVVAYVNANALPPLASVSETQNAVTAMIGRFSGYDVNLTYDHSGKLLTAGSPSDRTFATRSYDLYFQDAWKATRNLTLTLGLRYGLSRPVYETGGFEVKPNIPLSQYFNERVTSAAKGIAFNDPITMELSGSANGKGPMYPWDYKNFQPRIGAAWSPSFEKGLLRSVFGSAGKTVIRGGFSIFSDYYGEQLATSFDLNNTLGFSSSSQIPVNTYNVSNKLAPAFTGFGQDVRTFPNLSFSNSISFPQLKPSDMGERIEASLDSNLHTPRAYALSLTVERQLPAGILFQLSYAGRLGRSLLAHRDAMALNDLVDTKSGMDWYTAATQLEQIRATRPGVKTAVPTIPYFENIFPSDLRDRMTSFYGLAANCTAAIPTCIPNGFTPTQAIFWIARNFYGNDWTDLQGDLDNQRFGNGDKTLFFNPQYGSLTAWSTIGNSGYHGLSLSVRQRTHGLQWDFNYTMSHSLDDASGLQSDAGFGGASFILNPIRQRDWYANSAFDIRHIVNINSVFELPFGRGHWLGGNASRGLNALIGGYQLSGIFRWSTGLPLSAPFDDARWATNWQVQSRTVLTRPLEPCVTKGDANTAPKLFGCDTKAAYQSFRNAYPGEGGQRNIFRLPGVFRLDAGLSKSFNMPWSEKQKLALSWQVFNATNTQHFGAMDLSRSGYGLRSDPAVRNLTPPTNWSNFTDIQGGTLNGRREMQVGLRYSF